MAARTARQRRVLGILAMASFTASLAPWQMLGPAGSQSQHCKRLCQCEHHCPPTPSSCSHSHGASDAPQLRSCGPDEPDNALAPAPVCVLAAIACLPWQPSLRRLTPPAPASPESWVEAPASPPPKASALEAR